MARVVVELCPLDALDDLDVREALDAFRLVRAFPSVPLQGRALEDYDAFLLDALVVLQGEASWIEVAEAEERRKKG